MLDGHNKSYAVLWKHLLARFSRYMDEKTRDINHQDVISDLVGRTELSGSYLSSIILANLIALTGLLVNSVAVVIGAMLISPLMGPIFSLGLAFTIGDLRLTRRAVRNIVYSVLLAVIVAALFTLLSPLKEATHEIVSRTRPNIYDLLIAVFAGTAGALALCTRKNYLFTTTGVAVATAVIPPLSVVGYGLGTWQLGMAVGGFLLFFTNLVAIVISSNFIFYLLKFRGNMAVEARYSPRRRFQILGTLLCIISVPLGYTLVTDISKVRLTGRVERILNAHLNSLDHTRLTRVSIGKEDAGYVVSASINTVKYVDSEIQKKIESELTDKIGTAAKLELEQVIVRSGAVDPKVRLGSLAPASPPPPETIITLREKSLLQLDEGCRELETYIAPYKITESSITFANADKPIGISATIARDYPSDAQELRWMSSVLEKKLTVPIELRITTTPFLSPITFTDMDEIDENSRKALEPLKQIVARKGMYRLSIETPNAGHRSDLQHIKKRIANVKEYLIKIVGVQADLISVIRGNEKQVRVKITS